MRARRLHAHSPMPARGSKGAAAAKAR
jgi:hypothetical protein